MPISKKIQQYISPYIPIFIGCMLFSFIIYFMLMANQLVNPYDGLWEYSYYTAGYWELSLGRWFWLYLDQTRMGISPDPLTSLIALTFFAVGIILVLDIFEIKKKGISFLICGLFLSTTAVCVALSYRYMSPTFGLAFLLNIVAAWVLIKSKKTYFSIPFGALLIALAMGLYQAPLGCACLVLLGYCIYSLYKQDITLRSVFIRLIKYAVSIAFGGVLYVVILKIHLAFFHTALSGYNGASSYSLLNTLKNLPFSIVTAYATFKNYFFEMYNSHNIFQKYKIYIIIFAIVAILLLLGMLHIWKHSKTKFFVFLLFVLAIPLACNAVSFIATNTSTSIQMTTPFALCIPVLLCIISKFEYSRTYELFFQRTIIVLLALVLYGNIYQVQLDQNAMLEGKTATTTIADEIIHKLDDLECLDSSKEYCVLGLPAYNELFKTSALYDSANMYAKFGNWWLDPTCTRRSWQSTFHNLCGIDLPICSAETYRNIIADESVKDMSVFPNDGCIKEENGVVIIKVSEIY